MISPMTVEEICTTVGPIWFQPRYCRFVESVIYQWEHIPNLVFRVITHYDSNRHIKAAPEAYGKSWRCWKTKPSAEEMGIPFIND